MPHAAMSANHVAVITGGASGIGLAAAIRFARLGMKVCIADLGTDRLAEAEIKLSSAAPGGAADVMVAAADVSRIDHLAILALAPERNLEWLYEKHPEARSKKPQKGKKDGKGNEDAENGDQKGEPDQPNDQPGDPNDDKKPADQSPASTNTTLEQNQKDVKNGTANDGI